MAITVSELQVKVGFDGRQAESGLSSLGTKVGTAGSALATLGGAAVLGGIAALGAGLASSVGAAATFESSMSGIKAVSGATGAEMDLLRDKALDLGAKTSFSATEAAEGIGELIKAGVSIPDVMGGAAAGALSLAAAGAIEVKDAAEITSNALNAFGLSGEHAVHVADQIAGAANASAIDVNDFKFSLAAVGAVANTVGFTFEDTTAAIALLGNAGIKGSDAGTSLKTMFLNLQPATKEQTSLFKQLGLITADGANKFFDASGKVKSMSEVAGTLQTALQGMTQQQKLATLETIFGSDAIRAAAVFANEGAAGIDKMTESIGKVTAADVAAERLNNLKGSLEQLKGSLETAAIHLGTMLLPGLKAMVDGLTEGVNTGIDVLKRLPGAWEDIKQLFNEGSTDANFENLLMDLGFSEQTVITVEDWLARIGDAWRTMQQALGGNWSPTAGIDPFVTAVGKAATAVHDLGEFIAAVGQKASDMGAVEAFGRAIDHLGTAAGKGWESADKLSDAIGRVGGSAGSNEGKVNAFATAIRTIATGFSLFAINAGVIIDTTLTLGRVAADAAGVWIGLGKSMAGTLSGNRALAEEGARDIGASFGDMVRAALDWKTNTSNAFSEGMSEVKSLVGSGSQAAAAEHKRAVDSMVTVTQDSMREMEANTQIGMTGVEGAVETGMGAAASAADAGMSATVGAIEAQAPAAVAAAETMGTGMAGALEAAGPAMVAATDTATAGVVASVDAQAPAATAAAETMGTGMAAGIEAAGPAMASAAEGAASGAVAAVEGQQGAASAAGSGVGDALGSGMQSGILGWVGNIASAAANLVRSAIGAANAEAEIHSPSKKTQKVGEAMAEGLEVGLNKSDLGEEMKAKIRDFIEASRDYIPVAGQIAQVERRIKDIRDEAQTAALFRAKEMIDVDSHALRLKSDMVIEERKLLPLRREIASVGREIADIERGSLDARKQAITLGATNAQQNIKINELEKEKINELEKEKIPLQQRSLEIERLLLSEDPSGKRAKKLKEEQEEIRTKNGLIDNTISQIRLQTRAQELDLASYKESRVVESAGARLRKEEADDRLIAQEKNTTAIKDEIAVLDGERAVFAANEALIKNATDNEIAYRNRLIAVFTAEGKPLADRITAGKGLLEQLHDEGKISDELYNSVKKVTDKMGDAKGATTGFGNAADTAKPQIDAATKKNDEMAASAQRVADQYAAAASKVDALSKSLGKLPDWFKPTGSGGNGGSLFKFGDAAANGGTTYAGSAAIDGMASIGHGDGFMPVAPSHGGSGGGGHSQQTIRVILEWPDGRQAGQIVARGQEWNADLGLGRR